MKKLTCTLTLIGFMVGYAHATEKLTLSRIGLSDFQELSLVVRTNLLPEASKDFPLHFDEAQTFVLQRNNVPDFKLVPVTYNAPNAKNDVCRRDRSHRATPW